MKNEKPESVPLFHTHNCCPWRERQWKGHCFSVRGRTKTPPPDVIAGAMKHWQEAPFNCGSLKSQQPLDTCIAEKEEEKESSKVSNTG